MKHHYRFILFVVLLLASLGCERPYIPTGCVDTVLFEKVAPDGTSIVQIVERDCGATVDFATIVRLVPVIGGKKSKPRVIFISSGRDTIEVQWMDIKTLQIRHNIPKKSIFKEEAESEGVIIEYKKV